MHQRYRSVLPQQLQLGLASFARSLDRGVADPADVSSLTAMIGALPPGEIAPAMAHIATAAGLHGHAPVRIVEGGSWWTLFTGPRHVRNDAELLAETTNLEYLFLFHRSGYLREAALNKLDGALPGAFYVAAITYRLNDWVPQVRHAARDCLSRVKKMTDPDVLAAAGLALLARTESWRRWRDEADAFDEVVADPNVAHRLACAIGESVVGPMGQTLRSALRRSDIDAHLPELLRSPRQPSVRAIALKVLLDAKARWPSGTEKKWIDKSLGRYRMEPAWRERPLERAVPVEKLLEIGARDPAASVRKVAASGLVAHFDMVPTARALACRLLHDRNRTVRECAQFALDRAGRKG